MQRSFVRRLADISYRLLKPYGMYRIHRHMTNITYHVEEGVDFKRREPFLLIGNHQYDVDSGIYGTIWKKKPIAVISRSLMITPYKKFKYKFLASGIPKSQGEHELAVTREIIKTIKNGDAVMILPEGEISYFGQTLEFDNGIAKLAKLLGVDVITAVSKGGHIATPRWGYRMRRNRHVDVFFKVLISKEDAKELSLEEVYDRIKDELYVNDYQWQKEHKHFVGGKHMAVGLDHFIYACSECGEIHTIETKGNTIKCNACGSVGYFNEYGLIEGLKYDNLVDWNQYQRTKLDDLLKTEFTTKAIAYKVNYDKLTSRRCCRLSLTYRDHKLILTGKINKEIPIVDIKYFNLTQRNIITFDYEEQHYFLRIESFNQAFKMVSLGA